MTDIDLDAIKARAEAATAGPWQMWDGCVYTDGVHCLHDLIRDNEAASSPDLWFITRSRTDVPALIAEVERLRAQVERFREREARRKGKRKYQQMQFPEPEREQAVQITARKAEITKPADGALIPSGGAS